MKSALILEDNAEALNWMATRLERAFPGIEVTSSISVAQASSRLKAQSFDLALIDLRLPDGSGMQTLKEIGLHSPNTISIVVTIYDDDAHLFPALQAGAKGYLLKDMVSDQFEERIKRISSGEPPLSPVIARKILKHFDQPKIQEVHDLTSREADVLTLIAKGYTAGEVSQYLDISVHTVRDHIKSVYRKLDISSRSEATIEAVRLGLINSDKV